MAKSSLSSGNKLRKFDWGLIIAVAGMLGGSIFYLGQLSGKVSSNSDKVSELNEKVDKLDDRFDDIFEKIKEAKENAKEEINEISTPSENSLILMDGRLGSGLDMGVNTSGGKTDWVKISGNEMCMSYPSGQNWGSVFITVGRPTQPPRPSRDFSKYKKIVLEMKGRKGGETILIGLKDNQDPDDGSETKIRLNLTTDWSNYDINLADNFHTADLKKLYVVTEFVFESNPHTVCVRKVQFIK